ncbi:uncharacterized protein LOC141687146 [Apium graveolens]|uniref:uncharacterized protein LOC141687146 n=1 Tax=Apium graveolens TaxID=4045 RepID=UPI003D794159
MILTFVVLITSVLVMMAGRTAAGGRGAGDRGAGGRGVGGRASSGGRGRCGRGSGSGGDRERGNNSGQDGNRGRGTGGGGSGSGGQEGGNDGTGGRGSGSGSGGRGGGNDGNCSQEDNNDSDERGGKDDNDVRGQSSGASGGGGEGSGTAAREGSNEGGRKCTKRRRRRLHRDEEENSEYLLWDDEGRQILPVGVDSDPRSHRIRGYSPGGFGTYPDVAKVVRIAGNQIDCPKVLRNILAIIRMFWPDGCVGIKEIDRKSPGFWNKCIDEFLRYYTWDPRFSTEDEARASILVHMRDNMRRTLVDDRERADDKIAEVGGTYADHRPQYMKPGVWSRLAEYWVSEEFKKKSDAGKKAQAVVKVPHTSGARSFDHRRRDYMESHNGNLDHLVVYKDCHTLKDKERKGDWITEDAKNIIYRYISICEKKGVDPKVTQIQSWVEAVGGVRKNVILGHPWVRASDIYEPGARPPRPRKGEGSSGRSALTRLQDEMFMRVVDETLAQARANPEEYMLTPEQIRFLAQGVVEGDSSLPPNHPITRETRQAIVRVVVEVLNNIYKTDGPGAAKGKAPANEDDSDDGESNDESTESDEDRDMSHSFYDHVPRGGPVIRG